MIDTSLIAEYDKITQYLKSCVRSIPDYPKPGILFRDITTLCQDGQAFSMAVELMSRVFAFCKADKIVSAESRGYLFGAPLAVALKTGMVMVRKPGKLPCAVIEEKYDLEYGTNILQIHADAIKPGDRVLVIDDLLATGGTIEAMISLVKRAGGSCVAVGCLLELYDLGGAKRIFDNHGVECVSLVKFPGH